MSIVEKEIEFRKLSLFTKEEVIQSFNLTIEYIENDDEIEYTDVMRRKKLELCYKFKKSLEKCQLPKLVEAWWSYKYDFTGDGIDLYLCNCEDIELDEDGTVSSMTNSYSQKLISVKCDFLTVEQYATIQNVNPVTVRQWIRRGKLRNAKKNGRDWLIPSIEEKPSRGYTSVQYLWDELPEELLEQYPTLSISTSMYIYQDKYDKSKFICLVENFETKLSLNLELTRQEVEKLEVALISSGKVKIDDIIAQFVPVIKR